MIISRTPLRVSFFGGGTDMPEFFGKNGGAVLGTAINKYIYHSVSNFEGKLFDYNIKIVYSKIEKVKKLEDVKHFPYRAILKHLKFEHDLECHLMADLPAYSGLGSSSSFTVGLLNALSHMKNMNNSKNKLAMQAINLEREIMKESVGFQDQTFAAFGGLNLIKFHNDNG